MDDFEKRAANRRAALDKIHNLPTGSLGRPDLAAAVQAAQNIAPDAQQSAHATPSPESAPAEAPISSVDVSEQDTNAFIGLLGKQDGATVTTTELYDAYSEWADARGKTPVAPPIFLNQLAKKGLKPGRFGGRQRIKGVVIPTAEQIVASTNPSIEAQTNTAAQALSQSFDTSKEHAQKMSVLFEGRGITDAAALEKHMGEIAAKMKAAQDAAQGQDPSVGAALVQEAIKGTIVEDLSREFTGSKPNELIGLLLSHAAHTGEVPKNVREHRKTGKTGDVLLRNAWASKGGELLTSLMNIGPVTAGVVTTALSMGYVGIGSGTIVPVVTALIALDLMTKNSIRGKIAEKGSVRKGVGAFITQQPLRAFLYTVASGAVIYSSGKAAVRADLDTLLNAGSARSVQESANKLRAPLEESARVMDNYVTAIAALEKAVPGIESGLGMETELATIKETGIQVKPGTREGEPIFGPRAAQKFAIFHGTVQEERVRAVLPNVYIDGSAKGKAVETLVKKALEGRRALGLVDGQPVSARVSELWRAYLSATADKRAEALDVINELGRTSASLGSRTFTQNMVTTIVQPYFELGEFIDQLKSGSQAGLDQKRKVESAARRALETLEKDFAGRPEYRRLVERLGVPDAPTATEVAPTAEQGLQEKQQLAMRVRTLFQQIVESFQDSEAAQRYLTIIDQWSRELLGDAHGGTAVDARYIQERSDRLNVLFKEINADYAKTKRSVDTLAKGIERLLQQVDEGVATEAPQFSLPQVSVDGAILPAQSILMSSEELATYRAKHGDAVAYSRIAGAFGIAALLNFFFLLITMPALAASGRRSKVEVDEMLPKLLGAARTRSVALSESINAIMSPFIKISTGVAVKLTDPEQIEFLMRTSAREKGRPPVPVAGAAFDKQDPSNNSVQEFSRAVADTLEFWQQETASSVVRANLYADAVRSLETKKGLNQLIDRVMPRGSEWLAGKLNPEDQNRVVAQAIADRARFLELRQRSIRELTKGIQSHRDMPPDQKEALIKHLGQREQTDTQELTHIRTGLLALPAYNAWYASENPTRIYDGASSSRVRIAVKSGFKDIPLNELNLTPDAGLLANLYSDALAATKQPTSTQP